MVDFPSVISFLNRYDVYIFGLGREGRSSYDFIRTHLTDKKLHLIDDLDLDQLPSHWRDAVDKDVNLDFATSSSITSFPPAALIIKTPGIPLQHPLMNVIKNSTAQVTSNPQLFFDCLADWRTTRSATITTIGVTGTKGKSTTTALIHHVLQTAGYQTWLGGNIGKAPLDLLKQPGHLDQELYVVIELSSHQLDDLHTSPSIAVIQNIVPEHLDYYGSFERYLAAKAHITQFQTDQDTVVIDPLFELPLQLAQQSQAQKVGFITALQPHLDQPDTHQLHGIPIKVYRTPEWVIYDGQPLIKLSQLPLLGEHNLENTFPSIVIGKQLGLSNDSLVNALQSFTSLPHRLQLVADRDGVRFYNDSLSTVPEATIAALSAFSNQPVVLIAGGYDRGQDFGQLAKLITTSSVKGLILFPPTGERLAQEVSSILEANGKPELPIYQVTTMAEAMKKATALATAGDVVLLSPASASFGGFKDYQDRGEQFSALANKT